MEKLYKKTSKQEMAQNKCLTLNLITTNTKRDREKRKKGKIFTFYNAKT